MLSPGVAEGLLALNAQRRIKLSRSQFLQYELLHSVAPGTCPPTPFRIQQNTSRAIEVEEKDKSTRISLHH